MRRSIHRSNDCFSPKANLNTCCKSNIHSYLETLISFFTIPCSPIWHSQHPRCISASNSDLQNTSRYKTLAAGHRQSLSTSVENALVPTKPAVLCCDRMSLLSRCEKQHSGSAARQWSVEISNKRRLTRYCAKRFHFLLLCRWVRVMNLSTWLCLFVCFYYTVNHQLCSGRALPSP